ncbi:MAG: hypothetical protein ACKV1O_21465 [Saprospiraceae bacterium]
MCHYMILPSIPLTKKALLAPVLCLLVGQVFAQNSFEVNWDKPLESAKKNEQIQSIVATDGEYFVALRQKQTYVPYGFKYLYG